MVSTKNTTIYSKEINSENERNCETHGRQMVKITSVSWYKRHTHKRTEPTNTIAAMGVFSKWRQKKDNVAQVRFTKPMRSDLAWMLDEELSTHSNHKKLLSCCMLCHLWPQESFLWANYSCSRSKSSTNYKFKRWPEKLGITYLIP